MDRNITTHYNPAHFLTSLYRNLYCPDLRSIHDRQQIVSYERVESNSREML
jgi:hypothetical protein